jgi:hypothetical protein
MSGRLSPSRSGTLSSADSCFFNESAAFCPALLHGALLNIETAAESQNAGLCATAWFRLVGALLSAREGPEILPEKERANRSVKTDRFALDAVFHLISHTCQDAVNLTLQGIALSILKELEPEDLSRRNASHPSIFAPITSPGRSSRSAHNGHPQPPP